jgi:excisionase family DNA binding protein
MGVATPKYLSTREAADRLGVSLRSVQLWVENGVLRAWKTAGGHRRIPLDCIEEMLRLRAVTAGETPATPGFDILLIEDDLVQVELMRARLASLALPLPVHLRVSTDGYLGLIALGEAEPDLLLLDLGLPRMDGFAVLRALSTSADYQHLPVLVTSALSPAEVAERGGLPRGVAFLHKPVDFHVLRSHLLAFMPERPRAGQLPAARA